MRRRRGVGARANQNKLILEQWRIHHWEKWEMPLLWEKMWANFYFFQAKLANFSPWPPLHAKGGC